MMPLLLRADNNPGTAEWADGSSSVSEVSVWKDSVDLATTSSITLTPPPATIDGQPLQDEQRVLVKNQADGSENGIYRKPTGVAALIREPDYDTEATVKAGVKVYTKLGTANAKKTFRLFSPTTAITVGTTATSWEEDGGGGGGGGDWATTLALGATSGGTDPVLSSGDALTSAATTPLTLQPATTTAGVAPPANPGTNLFVTEPIIGSKTGNARGKAAIDLQLVRADATGGSLSFLGLQETQVAAADYSNLIGGRFNKIEASDYAWGATILGGSSNAMLGFNGVGPVVYGSVITGAYNLLQTRNDGGFSGQGKGVFISGSQNFVYAGFEGAATGSYDSVAMGSRNIIYNAESSFVLGTLNRVFGNSSSYDNGDFSLAGGNGSRVYSSAAICFGGNAYTYYLADTAAAFGHSTLAYVAGAMVWGSAGQNLNIGFARGAAQGSCYVLGSTTTDATTQALSTKGRNGAHNNDDRLYLRPGVAYQFRIQCGAYQNGGSAGTPGDVATWIVTGTIKNVGGTASFVGSPVGTGTPSGDNNAGAATWNLAVVADNTSGFGVLRLDVTGEVNKNIVWCARVDCTEVGDPT